MGGGPEWEVPMFEEFDWARPQMGPLPSEGEGLGESEHESKLEEELKSPTFWSHMGGLIGDYIGIFHESGAALEEASTLGEVGLALEAVGGVATLLITASELYKAFSGDQRIQQQQGLCYGLMLEAMGLPDVPVPETKGSPFGEGEVTTSDAERAAWQEGVAQGRALASYPPVREQILRSLAYEMASQNRDLETDPQHKAWDEAVDRTINRIYAGVRGEEMLEGGHIDFRSDSDGFPTKPGSAH